MFNAFLKLYRYIGSLPGNLSRQFELLICLLLPVDSYTCNS